MCYITYINVFICLEKLYKLMESFFFSISNYWPKTKKYSTNNKVGFKQAMWGGTCADQHLF